VTEFITKPNAFSRHSNKLVHGLSASALIWAYSTFPSKGEFEMLRQRQAETWIALQTIQNVLMQRVEGTNSAGFGQE